MKVGPVCHSNQPCLNKGKCIEQCETPGYRCECLYGFTGENCELIIIGIGKTFSSVTNRSYNIEFLRARFPLTKTIAVDRSQF